MAGAALRRRRLDRKRIVLLFGFTQWFSVRGLLALAAPSTSSWRWRCRTCRCRTRRRRSSVRLLTLGLLALTSWLSTRRRCAEVVAVFLLRIRYWRECPPPSARRARGAEWHDDAMRIAGRGVDRRILLGTCLAAWIAQGMCLYCTLRATGTHVGLDVLLLAYTVGIIASMVPLLPAGVGIVETLTPLILHAYGVPLAGGAGGGAELPAAGQRAPGGGRGAGAGRAARGGHAGARRGRRRVPA